MPYVKKTFRIDSELADELERYAASNGLSQTDAVQGAIRSAIQVPYACHTQEGRPDGSVPRDVYDDLRRQEASRMALGTTRAAQALHGAEKADALLAAAPREEGRKSRWRRLREAWRG